MQLCSAERRGVHLEGSPDTQNALESEGYDYAAVAGFGSMLPPEGGVPQLIARPPAG